MTQRNLRYGFIFFAAVLIAGLSACNKFVDTPIPTNVIAASVALNNDASVVAALAGAYASINNTAPTTITNGVLFSDEVLATNAASSTTILQAQENTYDVTTDYDFYKNYYQAIYNANLILDALAIPNTLTPEIARQVKGECEFLRAFCYYRLTNYFGNVPLVLTSNVTLSAKIPNTPVSQTTAQIIRDLTDAQALLQTSYPSEDRVRANSYTATALLARIYLQKKDWVNAEAASATIINSGAYALPVDPNTVFVKGSSETLWQLYNVNGFVNFAPTFIPLPTSTVFYQLRPELINLFEPNDLRKADWIKAGTDGAASDYYPYKYKGRLATTDDSTEYEVMFRLAEQYLIRAEARAEQNNISGSLADVNVIRARAKASALSKTSQEDLLSKIENERRMELMTEEGLRWFDLNRTGKTYAELSPLKPTFTAKAVLLPYTTEILLANPLLTQNPGY